MARPKEFDQEKVLRKAIRLFSQQGFAATSTDDLMRVMDIGRQSMYDTFGDKRALFLKALKMYVAAVAESQGSHQVAVVGSDHKVSMHAVKPGETVGTMWVIDEGVKPREQVVVEGLQKLKDGTLVTAKPVHFVVHAIDLFTIRMAITIATIGRSILHSRLCTVVDGVRRGLGGAPNHGHDRNRRHAGSELRRHPHRSGTIRFGRAYGKSSQRRSIRPCECPAAEPVGRRLRCQN